jgi:hypothetical protein
MRCRARDGHDVNKLALVEVPLEFWSLAFKRQVYSLYLTWRRNSVYQSTPLLWISRSGSYSLFPPWPRRTITRLQTPNPLGDGTTPTPLNGSNQLVNSSAFPTPPSHHPLARKQSNHPLLTNLENGQRRIKSVWREFWWKRAWQVIPTRKIKSRPKRRML